MGRIIVFLLVIVTGGSLADMLTPAERYKAWVAENQNWIKAVANWKKLVEASCNVSDADKYWREAFKCPDVPDITCHNDNTREIYVDSLGCSTTICNDGLYTDTMTFLEMWRQNFNTYKTMMSIYENNVVDCADGERKCLDSDAVTLEAWNSQSMKYSELSIALLEAKGDIMQLKDKSEDLKTITENYSNLSSAFLEAQILIAKLEHQAQDWEALNHKYSELSSAIQGVQNKSEERYSGLSSVVTTANENIEQLQTSNAANTQKYTELSNTMMETNKQVQQIHDTSADYCPVRYNEKCFWIEFREPVITPEQAREICSAKGAKLADLYSESHYFMMLGYLRMFGNIWGGADAWIGVTYNPQTNTTSLSDGTPTPFVRWYPGFPNTAYSSNVFLAAYRDWTSEFQNLANAESTWTRGGVICEK